MNKLAFALATVAALSVSTAVFAQTPAPAATPKAMQSQTQPTKQVNKRHHVRHYASPKGKKVAVKHAPATKPVRTKAAS